MPQELQNIVRLFDNLLTYAIFLGGPVAALFVALGGYQYATAGGSARKAENGQQTIWFALFGLGIIILAKVITKIVGTALGNGFVLG